MCSVASVTMWLPLGRRALATPLIARLFDSVAPLVKMISFALDGGEGHAPPFRLETVRGFEHGLVLDRRHDDVTPIG